MPTQYETNFIIASRENLAGTELLQAATDLLTAELQGRANESDYDLETYQHGDVGYSHISAERPHTRIDASVRLEARLCTTDADGAVAAQILTRFIIPFGDEPPDEPAGPPRLMHTVTQQFQCRVGSSEVAPTAVRLQAENAGEFATAEILNPSRTLPVFLISEGSRGETAFAPDDAQRILNGVARVVHCDRPTADALKTHTGIHTYNGAIRIYWPKCQKGRNGNNPDPAFKDFYMLNDCHGVTLYDIQKACLANEPDRAFDVLFSNARTTVILEHNRQLEAQRQQTAAPPELGGDTLIAKLKRDQRRAELRANETNRKLQAAQQTIADMEREREAVTETTSRLEHEINELTRDFGAEYTNEREERHKLRRQNDDLRRKVTEQEQTITSLNVENQLLKQRAMIRNSNESRVVIPLGNRHPCYITVLNHAVNIYRDPYRKYIVRRLRATHGDDLTDTLSKSVEFKNDQRALASTNPESAFDVSDFPHIINDNRECFDNGRDLSMMMREVRDIRNRAVHPPTGGISKTSTLDGLRVILDALKYLNEEEPVTGIVEIQELDYQVQQARPHYE